MCACQQLVNEMTLDQVQAAFESGALDDQYADYIMDHAGGDRIICNGDTLTIAMQDLYLADEFMASLVTE